MIFLKFIGAGSDDLVLINLAHVVEIAERGALLHFLMIDGREHSWPGQMSTFWRRMPIPGTPPHLLIIEL